MRKRINLKWKNHSVSRGKKKNERNAIKDERKKKCLSWKRLTVVIMLVFPRVTYNESKWEKWNFSIKLASLWCRKNENAGRSPMWHLCDEEKCTLLYHIKALIKGTIMQFSWCVHVSSREEENGSRWRVHSSLTFCHSTFPPATLESIFFPCLFSAQHRQRTPSSFIHVCALPDWHFFIILCEYFNRINGKFIQSIIGFFPQFTFSLTIKKCHSGCLIKSCMSVNFITLLTNLIFVKVTIFMSSTTANFHVSNPSKFIDHYILCMQKLKFVVGAVACYVTISM